MSVVAQHVAALILELATDRENNRLSLFERDFITQLFDRYEVNLHQSYIAQALRILEEVGSCESLFSPLTGNYCKINANPAAYFLDDDQTFEDDWEQEKRATELRKKYPVLRTYHNSGRDWIPAVASALAQHEDLSVVDGDIDSETFVSDLPVPAADRIVTINHNSAAFSDLVKETEEVDELIRKSNSIDGDYKVWVRDHIGIGLALIKKPKVLISAVVALLLHPLYAAYASIAEEAAKNVIWNLIESIKNFFGI